MSNGLDVLNDVRDAYMAAARSGDAEAFGATGSSAPGSGTPTPQRRAEAPRRRSRRTHTGRRTHNVLEHS